MTKNGRVTCSQCGHPLFSNDRFCTNCGADRENSEQSCPRCAVTVSSSAAFCESCGTPIHPGPAISPKPGSFERGPGSAGDSLENIRNRVSHSMKAYLGDRAIDQPDGYSSKPSGQGENGAAECLRRIRIDLPEMRGLTLGVGSPPIHPAFSPIRSATRVLKGRETERVVSLDLEHLDWLNYALYHANASFIGRVTVSNRSSAALVNAVLRLSVAPEEYGTPWVGSLGRLEAGDSWTDSGLRLPLHLDRLKRVMETEPATLKATVSIDGKTILARTSRLDIQPYNHFFLIFEHLSFLASFVTPNRPIINEIVARAAQLMKKRTGQSDFSGYQSRDPARVRQMAAALHDVLVKEYRLQYINPPASFEPCGQKIRFPEDIIHHGRGTCLDLSVLLASLLEHVGLYPIVVLIPGHAFVGVWTEERSMRAADPTPNLIQKPELLALLEHGQIVVFNSTTLCFGKKYPDAIQEGVGIVNGILNRAIAAHNDHPDAPNPFHIILIDIKACRGTGIKPLP